MIGFDKTKIKVVVVDLDETILHKGELRPGVADVLERINDMGIEVIIATGRQLRDIPVEVRVMQFIRYYITLNGASVFDCGENKRISHLPIDRELVLDIMAVTKGRVAYEHLLYDEKAILAKENAGRSAKRFENLYIGDRYKDYEALLEIVDDPAEYIIENSIAIYKMVFYFYDPELCKKILAELNEKFDVEAILVSDLDIELTARGASKGAGVLQLSESLGFAMSETVAIGDSGNDAEMLRVAGFPIAMGNASDELKSLALLVAPTVTEEGAVTVLEQLFFGDS